MSAISTSAPAAYDACSAGVVAAAYQSLSKTMASEQSPVVGQPNDTAQEVTAIRPETARCSAVPPVGHGEGEGEGEKDHHQEQARRQPQQLPDSVAGPVLAHVLEHGGAADAAGWSQATMTRATAYKTTPRGSR